MTQKHVIYGLEDPNTKLLRYTGYTSDPEERLKSHHQLSNLKSNNHKNNWIKSLLEKGQRAKMVIIAEYETAEELPAAEDYWHSFFVSFGADLTNDPQYIGTGSKSGFKLSEEHKQNISKSNSGKKFSDEHRKNLSMAMMGRVPWNKGKKGEYITSEETKQKISKSTKGKLKSEETKNKMSAAKMGEKNSFFGKHHTKEHKQKMSDKGKQRCIDKPHTKPPVQKSKTTKNGARTSKP